MKSVLVRSFSGPYFGAIGLNTERYGVSKKIQLISVGEIFHSMELKQFHVVPPDARLQF